MLNRFLLLDRPDRFPAVEGLRGLAVLMVFCVHFFAAYVDEAYRTQPGSLLYYVFVTLHNGGTGVDLFFVLSGFLIYLTTRKPDAQPVDFLARRYHRLLPAFLGTAIVGWLTPRGFGTALVAGLVVLTAYRVASVSDIGARIERWAYRRWFLVTLGVGVGTLIASDALGSGAANGGAVWQVGNWIAQASLVPRLFSGWRETLPTAWSVSVEVVFYLVFAAWLLARRYVGAVWLTAAFLVTYALAFSGLLDPVVSGVRPLPMERTPAFLVGVLLGAAYSRPERWSALRPTLRQIGPVGVVLLPLWQLGWHLIEPFGKLGVWSFFASFDIAAFFVVGVAIVGEGWTSRLLRSTPFRALGAVSYSLFLGHGFFIYQVPLPIALPGIGGMLVHFVFALALAFIAACVVFGLAERPYFTRQPAAPGDTKERWGYWRRAAPAAQAAMMAHSITLTTAIGPSIGWVMRLGPSRAAPAIQQPTTTNAIKSRAQRIQSA